MQPIEAVSARQDLEKRCDSSYLQYIRENLNWINRQRICQGYKLIEIYHELRKQDGKRGEINTFKTYVRILNKKARDGLKSRRNLVVVSAKISTDTERADLPSKKKQSFKEYIGINLPWILKQRTENRATLEEIYAALVTQDGERGQLSTFKTYVRALSRRSRKGSTARNSPRLLSLPVNR